MDKASIDKMTIVGDPIDNEAFRRLETYFQETLLLNRSLTKFPYRYMYKLPFRAGVFMYADKSDKVKQFRFEFNPKRAERKDVASMYKRILSFMKSPKINRVDVAFDYSEDLSDIRWLDSLGRPFRLYFHGKGALGTYYVGGHNSKMNIVMYDKRAERASAEGLDPEEIGEKDWWRIELRFNSADEVDKFMNDDTYNPFHIATPYYPVPVGIDGLKVSDKMALIALFTEHGQTLLAEMSRPSRVKYKKLMKEYSLPTPVDVQHDYEQQKNDLRLQVVSWLKYTVTGVF